MPRDTGVAVRAAPAGVALALTMGLAAPVQARSGLESADLHRLTSVGEARISPDARRIAYTMRRADRPGQPYAETWIRDVASGRSVRVSQEGRDSSVPRWSPDGDWLAYRGKTSDGSALMVVRFDGTQSTTLAPLQSSNHPLPSPGESLAWAPDGRRIAFVSAAPGPEGDPVGDPLVIHRYLYKPTAAEGLRRFSDNRRLHLFVVDRATRAVQPLTEGSFDEHSIAWSPTGGEVLFLSNRGSDPDRVFNYDVFAVSVGTGALRRLTDTKSAEYAPTWSPDGRSIAFLGTKRPLTSSETTLEDTHVWVMDAAGGHRRELGAAVDDRQGEPQWAPDGGSVYCTVQERGSVRLYRLPVSRGGPEVVAPAAREPGEIGSWSLSRTGAVVYAMATPASPAELYLKDAGGERALTSLNKDALASTTLAAVGAFTFKSFDAMEIEAFLTEPVGRAGASRHPLVVMLHGGPHSQQGPVFCPKAQVYAGQGWATLMVNYRGSTGYGQKLADAIFGDQNGAEAKDVLSGVDAALARYPWLDGNRLGIEGVSYGGQLTNWIVTQTDRFKAAVPSGGISNLVSFNYMAYYHDYLAVEFGAYPHENGLMDRLWERSPLRHVARVKTPTLLLHGENDNDVPIAEAEQLYIALKDVGVETVMVRYPREGHGLRETAHVVDAIDRSVAWYRAHFGPR